MVQDEWKTVLPNYESDEFKCRQPMDPLYPIQNDCCVLRWPDRKNYNEFFRRCPAHGCISVPDVNTCDTCNKMCNTHCPQEVCVGETLDSAKDYLVKLAKDGYMYPPQPKYNPGSASDTRCNRLKPLIADTMHAMPRAPVITDSHSLRAKFAIPKCSCASRCEEPIHAKARIRCTCPKPDCDCCL